MRLAPSAVLAECVVSGLSAFKRLLWTGGCSVMMGALARKMFTEGLDVCSKHV